MKIFNLKIIKTFLFENIGARQTVAKNTVWVGLSEFSINILKFFLLIYAARVLGDIGFGEFAFASSFVAVFGIFFDLGLSEAVTRELAKSVDDEKHIGALFSLKLLLSVSSSLLLIVASFFVVQERAMLQSVIIIMGGYMFLTSLSGFFYAVFRARQKMQYEFLPNFLQNLGITLFGFLLLSLLPTVKNLAVAYFLGAAISFIPLFIYFHKRIAELSLIYSKGLWKRYLKIAFPLALVGVVAAAVYNNIDSMMLGFFGQTAANGWYSAAFRVVTFSLLPAVFISQSFFPALAVRVSTEKEKQQELWRTFFKVILFLGIPITVGGVLLSKNIILFLYPVEFLPAAKALQWLFFIGLSFYVYMPFKQLLVVHNLQRKVFIVFLLALLINIGLNFFLIPSLSLYGTAIGTLIAHVGIVVGLVFLTKKYLPFRIFDRQTFRIFSWILLASIGLFFVLKWLRDSLHLLWLIAFGVVVYIGIIVLCYLVGKALKKT